MGIELARPPARPRSPASRAPLAAIALGLTLACAPARSWSRPPDAAEDDATASPGDAASTPRDALVDQDASGDPDGSGPGDDAATSSDATGADLDGRVDRDAGGEGDAGSASACAWLDRAAILDSPLPATSGRAETVRTGSFTDEYLYDSTGANKIAIRREWGGSIVFFGQAGRGPGINTTNTIDSQDTGREVQIALYDPDRQLQGCAWSASCASGGGCTEAIRYLGWNPVQGGNRCNQGSPTESVTITAGSLLASVVPLQWNPDWDARDCSADSCRGSGSRRASDVRVRQGVRFVGERIVELAYTIDNLSDLAHGATGHELPTMYTSNGRGGTQDLFRLVDPAGADVAIDTPTGGDGFFYENFTASAPWISFQNERRDYGIAILYENGLSDFQAWQLRSLPFNNVRSRVVFALGPHATVRARAYLLLGSFETIRAEATALLARLPPFGWLDAPGETVSPGSVELAGWALDNRRVTSVEARIDERVTVPLSYGGARRDVCDVWPGYPACDRAALGFSGTYDFGPPTTCPHLVEIVATDSDGNRRTIAERLVTVR